MSVPGREKRSLKYMGSNLFPSDPKFDRTELSDAEFIELLLYEIQELRIDLTDKERQLETLRKGKEEPLKQTLNDDDLNVVPQRSARRRPLVDDNMYQVPGEPASPSSSTSVLKSTTDDKSHIQQDVQGAEIKSLTQHLQLLAPEGASGHPKLRKPSVHANDQFPYHQKDTDTSWDDIASNKTLQELDAEGLSLVEKVSSDKNPVTTPKASNIATSLDPAGNDLKSPSTPCFTSHAIMSTKSERNSRLDESSSVSSQIISLNPSTPQSSHVYGLSGTNSTVSKSSPFGKGSSFQVLQSQPIDESVVLLVRPEDFSTVKIKIESTIYFDCKKTDDFFCTISINDKESNKEMWRIRKSYTQLAHFDSEIRPIMSIYGLPSLPDKALFGSTIPSRVDQRKSSLQEYFNTLSSMPHISQLVLYKICKYVSLDLVNPLNDFRSGAKMEGFLIRRYKGLVTTWKPKWCQIDGPSLELYDFPGGTLTDQIKLTGSQIGKQSADYVAEERGYRHAFLILESPKSKLSSAPQKHFFCAESDEERDLWINAMIEFSDTDGGLNIETDPKPEVKIANASAESAPAKDDYQKELKDAKKLRKRSLFPFKNKITPVDQSESHDVSPTQLSPRVNDILNKIEEQVFGGMEPSPNIRTFLFGQDLGEAIKISSKDLQGHLIPSVCFRCIEFLQRSGALYEEGIFRLSGSASTIKLLRDEFDNKHDIDLFQHPLKPDIHTVAGLLKCYLRELPSSIFGDQAYSHLQRLIMESRHLNPSLAIRAFLQEEKNIEKIYYDFCFVIFKLLKNVTSKSQFNKMSLKNVCIVFVPTLQVSLELLSSCVFDYECIFLGKPPRLMEEWEPLDLQIPVF